MFMPSRNLKVAIELRALVMTGFWPAIWVEVADSGIDLLAVRHGLADAHVQDDLVETGTSIAFL